MLLEQSQDDQIVGLDGGFVAITKAMKANIAVRAHPPDATRGEAEGCLTRALALFHDVESTCSRFDPASPLSRANATPSQWHEAPQLLLDVVEQARRAYLRTKGRFDPRVLATLIALGYDTSLQFTSATLATTKASSTSPGAPLPPWRPRMRRWRGEMHLGGIAIDLGGIAKGFAVRLASQIVAECASDYLVEAGGDCYCAGVAPDGTAWKVGVEDPHGGPRPVAVIQLRDRAVATSSTRVQRWRSGGELVHHLIDPKTSRPGGCGLSAVTVVADDPAVAEVLTKVLFLEGAARIAATADQRHIAALWIDDRGVLGASAAIEPFIIWRSA